MPQLKLAWWLLKFLFGWASLLIVFMMLSKILPKTESEYNKTMTNSSNKTQWTWN